LTTPPLGDFISVQLNASTPVPVINGVPGMQVTFANQDLTNTVTVARRNNFTQAGSNTATIPPLGSITVDASKTIWGLAPAGTLPLLIFPGGGNWAPSPAQVAAQINALGLAKESTQLTQTTGATIATDVSNSGVPLLPKSAVVVNDSAQTINAGATRSLGPFTLNRISYEIFCQFKENAAGTAAAPITVSLVFSDSTTGQTVDQCSFNIIPASNASATPHQVIITGPTGGDTVNITIKNGDTQAITSTLVMLQSSRIFTHDHKFLSLNTPTYITISTGGNDPIGGMLIDTAPNVGAGATAQRIMSCYNGQAWFAANIPVGGAASFFVQHVDPIANNFQIAFNVVMNAPPTRNTFQFTMPRSQCVMNLQNNAAGAGILSAEVLVQDN